VLRILLAALALAAAYPAEPEGDLDKAFDKIPFDQWLAGPEQSGLRWTVRATRSELSYQQRLVTRVEIQVDGADLAERRNNGELVIFIQIADQAGRRYQNHGSINLARLEDGIRSQYLTYSQLAFVMPGDYRVSLALLETGTSQHSTRQFSFTVPPLKNDPLPDAWRNLPPIEFVRSVDPPESWYQPGSDSKLSLPAVARHSIHPEVLVNLASSERAVGRHPLPHMELNSLMTSLNVMSQLDYPASPIPVALLDLSRQKAVFRQADVHGLEWAGIRSALADTNPGTIDVKSLEDRSQNAAFFVKEVRRRLDAPLPPGQRPMRVLIILSGVVEFEGGEDLSPIQLEEPRECRVYYFRFHSPRVARTPPPAMIFPGRRSRSGRPGWEGPSQPSDQLAGTLKPLSPRIFDIESPDQFRKALSRMLDEIASL